MTGAIAYRAVREREAQGTTAGECVRYNVQRKEQDVKFYGVCEND